jgi:hypothetical protein
LLSAHVLYARLLKTEKWRWYLYDIAYPAVAALTVATGFSLIWSTGNVMPVLGSERPDLLAGLSQLALLLMVGLAMLGATGFSTAVFRTRFIKRWLREV